MTPTLELIYTYGYPALIVIGNVSNILAFFVLQRNKFRKSSVSFFLRAYAIANLCQLDIILTVEWFCNILKTTSVQNRTDLMCRLWSFITNVTSYSGIWFLVMMVLDRLIFITSKTRAKSYCTTFAAKTICIFVLVGLVVVSIHAMWTFDLQVDIHKCLVKHYSYAKV